MSEEASSVVPVTEKVDQPLSHLQQLRMQHAIYCAERDKVQAHYNQYVGAIHACEQLIKKLEDEDGKVIN